jgi:hypothetical protein
VHKADNLATCMIVLISGMPSLLERSGPVQAGRGIAFYVGLSVVKH